VRKLLKDGESYITKYIKNVGDKVELQLKIQFQLKKLRNSISSINKYSIKIDSLFKLFPKPFPKPKTSYTFDSKYFENIEKFAA
jgi:hypothetical protein